MDRYKFRGNRIDGGGEVKGDLFHIGDQTYIAVAEVHDRKCLTSNVHGNTLCSYEVHPDTIGQYTGLKDKNGTDLNWWENDLLRKGSDHPNAPISIIAYSEQDARWVIVDKSGSEFCGLADAYRNGWHKIGTIHDKEQQ